jgi:phage gpG-like protein
MRIEIFAPGGARVFSRDLLRFGENAADLTDAMRDVATILRHASERQFDTEGGYTGEKWPELAASTQRDRARHHFPPRHPILQRTHRLMDSLTRAADPDHIEEPSADSLRFGTRVPYAVYHQSSRPRHKIPFRPPVGLTEADKRQISRVLQRKIMEGVRG